ncbi:MAG: hypothetical protein LBC56_05850 [Oscillospiraceae bacterium]|jgi:hypothetical protein|nr:hypothetical protein [Oscillospiraceae bacterium]
MKKKAFVILALVLMLSVGLIGAAAATELAEAAADGASLALFTTYDVGNGPFIIQAGSGDYRLTGSYTGTGVGNIITVASGYTGTVILDNADIRTEDDAAPFILAYGGADNGDPATKVELVLVGENSLYSGTALGRWDQLGYAALDVTAGTQVTISGSGTLNAITHMGVISSSSYSDYGYSGAAGIGAGYNGGPNPRSTEQFGGNVIIKSGIINAQGGDHGAGIGGGWSANSTNVIILGGTVKAVGGIHAAGIGKGCGPATGSLLILPPANIVDSSGGFFGAVGEMQEVFYWGDPALPAIDLTTSDLLVDANIYADFGNYPVIAELLQLAGVDPGKYLLGKTDGDGVFSTTTVSVSPIVFFTDAVNSSGQTYFPFVVEKINAPESFVLQVDPDSGTGSSSSETSSEAESSEDTSSADSSSEDDASSEDNSSLEETSDAPPESSEDTSGQGSSSSEDGASSEDNSSSEETSDAPPESSEDTSGGGHYEGDVYIPGGFEYVEGSLNNGLVIQDETGNQFVWIPVTEQDIVSLIKEDVKVIESDSKLTNLVTAGSGADTPEGFLRELKAERDELVASLKKYGGFYIGRYETGDLNKAVPVVKKDNNYISLVSWYASYNKSHAIYAQNPFVGSGLLWASQWDAMVNWLESTIPENANYGTVGVGRGNFQSEAFEYIKNGVTQVKKAGGVAKIPTGSYDSAVLNNIYDISGNVWEWTMEARGANFRINRGGGYNTNALNIAAGSKSAFVADNSQPDNIGFRIQIYIKDGIVVG